MTRHTAGDVEQLQGDFARSIEDIQNSWFNQTREERTFGILATAFGRLLTITQHLAERIEALEAAKEESGGD
jgi:hypothetical protein